MDSQLTEREEYERTSQHPPESAKTTRTIIPAPQRERIMHRHVSGDSIRQIARKERRDRATVAKIVHGEDMRDYVIKLREQFYALGQDALASVEHGLVENKDGHLGYRLLADIGVVPVPGEVEPIPANREVVKKDELTEWEQAIVGDAQGVQARIMVGLARVAEERAKIYGLELEPTPHSIRRNRAIHSVIDFLTEGRGDQLCRTNQKECNRLSEMIKPVLVEMEALEKTRRANQPNAPEPRPKLGPKDPTISLPVQANDDSNRCKTRLRLGDGSLA